MIEKITFENFTAFDRLDLEFSPGINVFIGKNSTGKTHILKAIYAACDVSKRKTDFTLNLESVFLSADGDATLLGRINPQNGWEDQKSTLILEIQRSVQNSSKKTLDLFFSLPYSKDRVSDQKSPELIFSTINAACCESKGWTDFPIESVYIPAKDVLANFSKYQALYKHEELIFERVHNDLISRATRRPLREIPELFSKYVKRVEEIIGGTVVSKTKGNFFLQTENGEIEFALLAEGFRKLGLLTLLLKNGILAPGTVLCWDEPEANLNPEILDLVVDVLLFLQRQGVQIFLATHDYILARYFDLRAKEEDEIAFFSLFDEQGEIRSEKNREFRFLKNNSISAASDRLLEEVFDGIRGKS